MYINAFRGIWFNKMIEIFLNMYIELVKKIHN